MVSFHQVSPPNPVYASPFPIHATSPVHLIFLDFIVRAILGEQNRSLSSPLCSFLQSHVTSSLLGPTSRVTLTLISFKRSSPYRAVNTLRLGHKNQHVDGVQTNNWSLLWDSHTISSQKANALQSNITWHQLPSAWTVKNVAGLVDWEDNIKNDLN
jgi:hypothetical protein